MKPLIPSGWRLRRIVGAEGNCLVMISCGVVKAVHSSSPLQEASAIVAMPSPWSLTARTRTLYSVPGLSEVSVLIWPSIRRCKNLVLQSSII